MITTGSNVGQRADVNYYNYFVEIGLHLLGIFEMICIRVRFIFNLGEKFILQTEKETIQLRIVERDFFTRTCLYQNANKSERKYMASTVAACIEDKGSASKWIYGERMYEMCFLLNAMTPTDCYFYLIWVHVPPRLSRQSLIRTENYFMVIRLTTEMKSYTAARL